MKPARWFYDRVTQTLKDKNVYVSFPCLKFVDNKLYEAIFVAPKTKGGKFLKPTCYTLYDYNTGKIDKYSCKEHDFIFGEKKKAYRYAAFVPAEDDIEKLCDLIDYAVQLFEECSTEESIKKYKEYRKELELFVDDEALEVYDQLHWTAPTDTEPEKGIPWTPTTDLTGFKPTEMKYILSLASSIEFLESSDPNKIKFAYPIHCSNADRLEGHERWTSLMMTVQAKKYQMGHFKTKKNGALATKCSSSEDCLYERCPYVAAAYARYLAENKPYELVVQVRYAYKDFSYRGCFNKNKVEDPMLLLRILATCDFNVTTEVVGESILFGVKDARGTSAGVTYQVPIEDWKNTLGTFPDTTLYDTKGEAIPRTVNYIFYALA